MVSFTKGILVNKRKKKTFSSWNLIKRPTRGKMAIMKDTQQFKGHDGIEKHLKIFFWKAQNGGKLAFCLMVLKKYLFVTSFVEI